MDKRINEKSENLMYKKVEETRNPKEYKINKRTSIILSKILREYKRNFENNLYHDENFNSIISHYMINGLCPDVVNEDPQLTSEIMMHVGNSRDNIFSEYIARESGNMKKNFRIIIGSCALLLMASYGYSMKEVLYIFESERWKKKIKEEEITLRISSAVKKICRYESLDTFLMDKIQSYQLIEENKEETEK